MFAPEIVIKNAVVENDRINSDSYLITLNFCVIDQYNDSGLGSWIENQDVRKYIKFKIYYNLSDKKIVTLPDLIDTDIQNYLVTEPNGSRRYEYPISWPKRNSNFFRDEETPIFSKSVINQTIKVEPFFDLRQYVLDQGLSNSGIINENGESKTIQVIKNGEILNSPNIINNVIIEDVEKLQINLSFVDSFEKNIVSIIETDTNKNKDISAYVTDLFISKNEDNTHSFLFGVDKKKIIQTKTQLGNYITAVSNLPQLQSIINDNIQINKIYVTKRQVKKVKSFSKLGNVDNDYINYNDIPTVLLTLNDSNKTNISNNSSYDFYSFTDTSADNDNSIFQYTLTIQLQDSFKESLIALQTTLLNNITTLEQYYNQISIPASRSFGYYDIQTNTFKNNAESLIPSNLTEITTNFSILYFFMSAINKSNLDTAFVYLNSTSLVPALQKSLSVSTSSLYVIKKTIEIMKNFASIVERVLDIQLVDIQPEQEGPQTIKIGTNATEIVDLTYTFNSVVENTYYNNFKENKILIFEPSQEVNNFPIITTSKLASLNRFGEPLLQNYSPILGQNIHKLFGENTAIGTVIGIDSKESRLLISYINNLMSYLQEKDFNIQSNNTDERVNKIGFRSTLKRLNYKTLIGDLLSQSGVEILSFKEDTKPERLESLPYETNTARDPLGYAATHPRDYPISTNINTLNLSQLTNPSNDESVTRLLNYILSKLNLSNNDSFAKLNNEEVNTLIDKFIPKYNIQYLDTFGENIKDYNWTNFNVATFSSFPLRTNLLCRLKPIYENETLELKNVIDNLQVPYMYFILIKDSGEYENSVPFTVPFPANTRGLTLSASITSQGRFTSNQTQRFEPNRSRRIKKIRTK